MPLVVCAVLLAGGACEDGGRARPPTTTAAPGSTLPPAGEVPAALVLDEALNLVERRPFYAGRVDWPSVRAEAWRRVAAATTRAEVYQAIRWVLSRLGDHHSFLLTPQRAAELAAGRGRDFGLLALFPERVVVDVEPGGAAERAGVRVGDVVEAVDGRPVQGEEVVTLPAPTAGGGPARVLLTLRRGGAGRPARLPRPRPPVAVLTSRLTGSAGEAVAMAFRGRPGARSFGEPTAGVPTGNTQHRLADGAELYLTEAIGVDRTGRTYETRIRPDRPVATDWARYGTPADPVLAAATRWLGARCAGR